ncbi:hypothetical protein Goarm_022284, partial [Gossypium armourianum]|nr:hypothetical protein [Gossypium armourianum]
MDEIVVFKDLATADLLDISSIQAILFYAILQKKQVCVVLCKRVGVPMEQLDKKMNPPKKLLGDD